MDSKIELTVDDPKGKIVWNWNFSRKNRNSRYHIYTFCGWEFKIWGYNEYKELTEALENNEDENEK